MLPAPRFSESTETPVTETAFAYRAVDKSILKVKLVPEEPLPCAAVSRSAVNVSVPIVTTTFGVVVTEYVRVTSSSNETLNSSTLFGPVSYLPEGGPLTDTIVGLTASIRMSAMVLGVGRTAAVLFGAENSSDAFKAAASWIVELAGRTSEVPLNPMPSESISPF